MNPNDPAFPGVSEILKIPFVGLTKREYFAAMAMQRLRDRNTLGTSAYLANQACQDADALIAKLSKEKPKNVWETGDPVNER